MILVAWGVFLTFSTVAVFTCETIFPVLWRLIQRRALRKGAIELTLRSQSEMLFNHEMLYDFYHNKDLSITKENVIARYKEGVFLYELHGASFSIERCYWPLVSSLRIKIGQRLSLQNYAFCIQELLELKVLLKGEWELPQDSSSAAYDLSIAALSALQEPGNISVAL